MKVELINYTQDALETLVFTKSTRLKMSAEGFQTFIDMPEEQKMAEWKYMQNTIKSSWEFVDYIFAISGVSRAFTHQLVRHRIGTSFAQQSQRTVDMSGFDYIVPEGMADFPEAQQVYGGAMADINDAYQHLVSIGTPPQDARGLLPTNVSTNIIFKANLRTLNGMCAERLCVKAQGEFQSVMRAIRDEVVRVHSWTEPALRVYCAQHGTCAFPSFSGCPIKGGVFNPETGLRYDENEETYKYGKSQRPLTRSEIQAKWSEMKAEANPFHGGKK